MDTPEKEFVFQLTDWQGRLFGYLMSLLGDVHDARDVLQETNLILWRKMNEFEPGTDFGAWARSCAYFQSLAFLRDRKRDRHVFDDDLLHQLAHDRPGPGDEEERVLALRDCLSTLPDRQREVLQHRYRDGSPVRALAERFGKKESAMKMSLMRTRQALLSCIRLKLEAMT